MVDAAALKAALRVSVQVRQQVVSICFCTKARLMWQL
jgi:hypothetical protein